MIFPFFITHFIKSDSTFDIEQLAAHYLMEKRSSLEEALSKFKNANEIDSKGESVSPSVYVGQFSRLHEEEDKLVTQV